MSAFPSWLRQPLPFYGQIAAGWPSPAEEELGDMLTFEEWLVPHKEASCLVTIGTDLLREAGILKGDIVIMERGRAPQKEDIVIVEADGTPLVRTFKGAGAPLAPVPVPDASEVRLLGVVTTVIRKYR